MNSPAVTEASLADLMMADIWAFGMVVFNLINPGLQHPYELNIKNLVRTPLILFQEFARKNERPVMQSKYESLQSGEWAGLKNTFELCTTFEPSSRPSIENVLDIVGQEMRASSVIDENLSEIHLKVSQATAIQNVDQAIIQRPEEEKSQQSVPDVSLVIADDATNACAFLTMLIAHELYSSRLLSWGDLATTAEVIIVTQPHVFNRFRDVSLHYDVMEAYTLLKNNNCLPGYFYSFTEEIPFQKNALSPHGKENLLKAVASFSSREPSFGFYTCGKFIFLTGFYNSEMFILDTHEVPSTVGGTSAGLIKRFCGSQEKAAEECCQWLWKRLASSKLDGPQSLAIMVKRDSERFVIPSFLSYIYLGFE